MANHNLAVQPNPPPPEVTPSNVATVKNHARQLPVHSFQVNRDGKAHFVKCLLFTYMPQAVTQMQQIKQLLSEYVKIQNRNISLCFQVKVVRYGRQTVSVDVDTGVLLFDKKAGSFGVERVSQDRRKQTFTF